jgi:CTP-dependent riboflavin kinase
MEKLADRWREVDVCPALVDRKALAFVIRQPVPDNPRFCEMFAPTDLTNRLGLRDGSEVQLALLPGSF